MGETVEGKRTSTVGQIVWGEIWREDGEDGEGRVTVETPGPVVGDRSCKRHRRNGSSDKGMSPVPKTTQREDGPPRVGRNPRKDLKGRHVPRAPTRRRRRNPHEQILGDPRSDVVRTTSGRCSVTDTTV